MFSVGLLAFFFTGKLPFKRSSLVETVIGQLTERFHIEKVRTHDTWHLANRFICKLLVHIMGCFLGKLMGSPTLLFESLVEV